MFDRHRQPWQCSIITDCRGGTVMVLPASCPHSVVTMGNCRLKIKVLNIPLSGRGGGGSDHKCLAHKGEKKYCHQSFVTTPQPGK